MFARILAIAIAVIVLSGCWRTVGAPIGLRLEQSGTGKNCKSPTKSTTSGAASPLFREVRGVDLERQIPPKVRSTKVMQAYISKLDEVLQSKEAAPPLAGTAVTPRESRQFNAEATRLELTPNEFKDFLHAFDEEVLDLNTLSVPRNDVFTAKSNQKPGLMRLYRFYLIAYSHGKYVDRQGHIYDAPNLSKGIDNQVISNSIIKFLALDFFDYPIINRLNGIA